MKPFLIISHISSCSEALWIKPMNRIIKYWSPLYKTLSSSSWNAFPKNVNPPSIQHRRRNESRWSALQKSSCDRPLPLFVHIYAISPSAQYFRESFILTKSGALHKSTTHRMQAGLFLCLWINNWIRTE